MTGPEKATRAEAARVELDLRLRGLVGSNVAVTEAGFGHGLGKTENCRILLGGARQPYASISFADAHSDSPLRLWASSSTTYAPTVRVRVVGSF